MTGAERPRSDGPPVRLAIPNRKGRSRELHAFGRFRRSSRRERRFIQIPDEIEEIERYVVGRRFRLRVDARTKAASANRTAGKRKSLLRGSERRLQAQQELVGVSAVFESIRSPLNSRKSFSRGYNGQIDKVKTVDGVDPVHLRPEILSRILLVPGDAPSLLANGRSFSAVFPHIPEAARRALNTSSRIERSSRSAAMIERHSQRHPRFDARVRSPRRRPATVGGRNAATSGICDSRLL